jgi:hypothetical protein
MSVEIIERSIVDFNKFESSEKEKFNLWPVEFNSLNYHTARLKNIPVDKVLFFAHSKHQSIQAVLEFQYNDYDTQLRGFTCCTVINIYHNPEISTVERKESINELFKFLQEFRKKENIKFCFIAINNWDSILSTSAQQHGFNFILTWGKCFYNKDAGIKLPQGYSVSSQKNEKHLSDFLEMTKNYFKGGRFYLDPSMDILKTDKMYNDLVASSFNSPGNDFMVLRNADDKPIAAFICKKETYSFNENFEVRILRLLLSDAAKLPRGFAAAFLSETSQLLSTQVALVESGIEMHNLPSLKIHTDAGYKFNFIYSAYHSWI